MPINNNVATLYIKNFSSSSQNIQFIYTRVWIAVRRSLLFHFGSARPFFSSLHKISKEGEKTYVYLFIWQNDFVDVDYNFYNIYAHCTHTHTLALRRRHRHRRWLIWIYIAYCCCFILFYILLWFNFYEFRS